MSRLARVIVAAALAYAAVARRVSVAWGPGKCPDCRGTGQIALTVCNRCGGLGRPMSGQERWPR